MHLRLDTSAEDDLVEIYLQAAVAHVDGPDGFLGRALVDQTWDLYLDEFPESRIEIPLPPLIEVLGVFYQDGDGVEQTFSSASYVVDSASEPARITLGDGVSWPTILDASNAVRIRFRAGYVTGDSPYTANVPAAIKAAILLHVGDLYRYRETMAEGTYSPLPWAAEQLLRPYRVYRSLA
jgi:uncharacterized phiE125 gp8 family phage protein